jgi:hypothetical protein
MAQAYRWQGFGCGGVPLKFWFQKILELTTWTVPVCQVCAVSCVRVRGRRWGSEGEFRSFISVSDWPKCQTGRWWLVTRWNLRIYAWAFLIKFGRICWLLMSCWSTQKIVFWGRIEQCSMSARCLNDLEAFRAAVTEYFALCLSAHSWTSFSTVTEAGFAHWPSADAIVFSSLKSLWYSSVILSHSLSAGGYLVFSSSLCSSSTKTYSSGLSRLKTF